MAGWLCAQEAQPGAAKAPPQVRMKEIVLDGFPAPEFRDNTRPKPWKGDRDWLQVLIRYETRAVKDGWLDEVRVKCYVALLPAKAGKPLLLSTEVTYIDVKDGLHNAALYVRPAIIERYTGSKRIKKNSIAVYVEVTAGEGEPATIEHRKSSDIPAKWWEGREPRVFIRDNELLPPAETPFAFFDYDYYEHMRLTRQAR
jgi:hypothetical protein